MVMSLFWPTLYTARDMCFDVALCVQSVIQSQTYLCIIFDIVTVTLRSVLVLKKIT